MVSGLIISLALFIHCGYVQGNNKDKERDLLFRERFSQFYCYKLIGCHPNGPKVCGFDERAPFLAYFADICTMYQANCKKAGFYTEVKIEACDVKQNYTKLFDDEFKFEHIVQPTKPPKISNFTDATVLRIEGNNKTINGTIFGSGMKKEENMKNKGLGVFRLM